MTHTAQTGPIDPNRPWLIDSRDDPAAMNWWGTLTWPFGTSPKLHFTRAWTFMFMARLLSVIIPGAIIGVISMAGGDPSPIMPVFILTAVIFILTVFTSFSAHMRRLSDAGRPLWMAALPVLPMLAAFLVLALIGGSKVGEVREMQARQAELAAMSEEERDAVIAKEREEARKAREAARANGETSAQRGRRGGQRGGPGGRGGPQSQNAGQIIFGAAMGPALLVWALTCFGVMLWSLLYVARLPNEGEGPLSTGQVLPDGTQPSG